MKQNDQQVWPAPAKLVDPETHVAVHRFVTWLIATRRLRPDPGYLVVRRPRLGISLSRHWPVFHAAFMTTAAALGFSLLTARA